YPIAYVYERYFFTDGTQTIRMAFPGTDIARGGVRWTVPRPRSRVDRRPSVHDEPTDRRLGWAGRRMELHDEGRCGRAVRATHEARDLHRRPLGFCRGPRRGRARRLPGIARGCPREPGRPLRVERLPLEGRRHRCRPADCVRVPRLRPRDDRYERGLAIPRGP